MYTIYAGAVCDFECERAKYMIDVFFKWLNFFKRTNDKGKKTCAAELFVCLWIIDGRTQLLVSFLAILVYASIKCLTKKCNH